MNNSKVAETFEWLKNCLPKRSVEQQEAAVRIYRELAKGVPLSVDAQLETLIETFSGLYKNDNGDIVGFWGLALDYDSHHRLIFDGVAMNTWCAWDSLFIPEIVGKPAQLEFTCPITNTVTRLKVTSNEIVDVSNSQAVISFVEPRDLDENIIKNFCHYIYCFKDQATFEQWKKNGHEDCFALSLEEAFELGRLKNEYEFCDTLE